MARDDFWKGLERSLEEAVERAEHAARGGTSPTAGQVAEARHFLEATRKYTETELARMSDLQLVQEVRDEQARQAIGVESKVQPGDAVRWAEKAQEAQDVEAMRNYLRGTGKYRPDEIERMTTSELVGEIKDEAERQSIGNASRLEPATLKLHLDAEQRYRDRKEVEDYVVDVGGFPRDRVESMTRDELAALAETTAVAVGGRGDSAVGRSRDAFTEVPTRFDPSRTGSTTGTGTGTGTPTPGTDRPSGSTTGGSSGGSGRADPTDGFGFIDPAVGQPATDAAEGGGAGDDAGSTPGQGPSDQADDSDQYDDASPGGDASSEEGTDSGWTYLGDDHYDLDTGEQVQLWADADGNIFARYANGEMRPITSGETTVSEQRDSTAGGGEQTGDDTDQPPPDESDTNGDDDGGDDEESSGDDSSGGEEASGEEAGGGVGYTPVDDVRFVDLRRIDLDPGALTGSGGDIDPGDPLLHEPVPAGGELVDLKHEYLIGPSDPEIVGGTGGGTIPESIQPDSGVIRPGDDSATGPGGMGPEDDPLGDMAMGLEPAAPDGEASDGSFDAVDSPLHPLADLDIEVRRADSIMDFDGFDD